MVFFIVTTDHPYRVVNAIKQQRLGVLKVGGVGALAEPAVNLGEHRARFITPIVVAQQTREAGGGVQFPGFGTHLLRKGDGLAEVGIGQCVISVF